MTGFTVATPEALDIYPEVSGGTISWPVTLALLDWYERDDDRLRERFPAWVNEDVAEQLLECVLEARPPPRAPLVVEVRQAGVMGRRGFRLQVRWLDRRGRRIDPIPRREGGLVEVSGHWFRLTAGQYGVVEAIDRQAPGRGDRAGDASTIVRVKAAVPADDPGVCFDRVIADELVVRADRVEPKLKSTAEGGYQVAPRVDGVPDEMLWTYYARTSPSRLGRTTMRLSNRDGTRTTVVFTDRAGEAFRDLRRINQITAEQAAEALTRPEDFFGDNLDTSAWSQRVVGLGVDVRAPVALLRVADVGDWWAWPVELESHQEDANPLAGLQLGDPDVRRSLAAAVVLADQEGRGFVPHPTEPGVLIELTTSLREALVAAQSAAEAPEPEVLQVRDNIEDLSFAVPLDRPDHRAALERPPGLLAAFDLKPHQHVGYEWLGALNGGGSNGALLADDMGLGKTIQVLAHLAWLGSQGRRGPHLVVAPVALLGNWIAEARRFFGASFEPIAEATRLPSDLHSAAAWLAAHRLVLVSYGKLRREERAFAIVDWDTVVLDEAQKAKNPDTQTARVIRTLKSRFRLGLTGTPVENRLEELWAIYDWALPGCLGSLKQFQAEFVSPAIGASERQRAALSERLQDRISAFFLRRLKSNVADLPPLVDRSLEVGLAPSQAEAYALAIARVREAGIGKKLGVLNKLFGICAHPDMGHTEDGHLAPLTDCPFPKGQALFEILDGVHRSGEKALVFAGRKHIQRWIADETRRRYRLRVDVINGDVTGSKRRLDLIESFSAVAGFNVLVLAPRAAGLGLNITAANHVIHYMREWNPAVEKQATDRAYRIGQTRPVTVYTVTVTTSDGTTVEQRLARLLSVKRQLTQDFVVPVGALDVERRELLPDVLRAPVVAQSFPHAWLGLLDKALAGCLATALQSGLPTPVVGHEVGTYPGRIELAWPELRVGLLLDTDDAARARLQGLGWVIVASDTSTHEWAVRAVRDLEALISRLLRLS